MRRLVVLLKKEFLQLLRDKILIIVLIYAFTIDVYVGGEGVKLEVNKFPTIIQDQSKSFKSRELISRFREPYFKILAFVESDKEVVNWLDKGKASMAIIISPDFERKVDKGQGKIQVIIDGTMSITATMAVSYVAEITNDYAIELLERKGGVTKHFFEGLPQIDERTRVLFNPNCLSHWFMGLAELFNVVTMVPLLITAAVLIKEKEYGTIEQLLVTPVRSWEIFLAKILPTVIIVSLLTMLSIFIMIKGVFKVPIRGNLFLFYIVTCLYIFTLSSIGIAIATMVRNLSQAMMVIMIILVPMLMISGVWTPPEAMRLFARYASLLSPMRYYLNFGYGVILKGNGLKYVWQDILGIILIGGLLLFFSALRFRQSFAK
ncbi:MAG: ABC-type multidrug transport system [Thermodesulfobacterium sp.]|uniref:ABC-type multidrug transport system n=1 Tax=Candidatus Thermodesulfobacterium syntrophicum TaxID=3060442 RepID=A0AAE3P5G2_9BACT|nr:ABC-type multidrug transport system [Candidatus Thermodesulfobacterium syntrophicum]